MIRHWITCILSLCIAGSVHAQLNQQKKVIIAGPILHLDSFAIDALSLEIQIDSQRLIPNLDYYLIDGNTALKFDTSLYEQLAYIKYRRFNPLSFETRSNNLLFISGQPNTLIYKNAEDYNSSPSNIQSLGILSRGISFGNSQDLVLNSALNLRLNGKVSDKISIEGAITDQEFPFQPEGTTSTLQDFDRIYLKFYLPKSEIILGDHAFQNPKHFAFMKYNKKNRGLQWKMNSENEHGIHRAEIDAALARGRFSRNEITGIEGLQGPYKLTGARNEQFIIVISGTENVFLDGKKMQRGLQADYTIDYNLGEITFTPKNLINTFSRIIVEFQYSDRYFARTIASGNYSYQTDKLVTYVGLYTENDLKNQSIQQSLELFDSTQLLTAKEILEQSGDNFQTAGLNGATLLDGFSSNAPNYVLADSMGKLIYAYVDIPGNHTEFYSVLFNYLGPGKGNYILDGTSANGKVYKYVAPISGNPSGSYEPIVQIFAPNAIQMTETGLKYNFRPNSSIHAQLSGSRQDLNTFSSLNDNDNTGWAGKITLNHRHKLGRDSINPWSWDHQIVADYSSQNFRSIERFRDLEVSRNWNKTLNNEESTLVNNPVYSSVYTTTLEKKKKLKITSTAALFNINNDQIIDLKGNLRYSLRSFYIEPSIQKNESKTQKRTFSLTQNTLGFKNKTQDHSITLKEERSKTKTVTQTYSLGSYGYDALELNSSMLFGKTQLGGTYQNRLSYIPQGQEFIRANAANNYSAYMRRNKKTSSLFWNFSFRESKLLDTQFSNQYSSESHLSSRVEYNFFPKKSFVRFNTYYQTISGREQQRQFAYFEVPAGQGFYSWQDYDGNGIREINEFEQSPFQDQAKFVRLLIPTGQYITSQASELNGNFSIQKPEKKNVFKVKNTLTFNLKAKTITTDFLKKVMPYLNTLKDTNTINGQYFIRNQTEFETKNGVLFIQQTGLIRQSKVFLTNGFDSRSNRETQTIIRLSPNTQWQIVQSTRLRKSEYNSEFIPNNSYQYNSITLAPSISWQPGIQFRIKSELLYTTFQNAGNNYGKQIEGKIVTAKSVGKGGLADVQFSYIKNEYNQTPNTPLAFDILQGFSIGNNFRGQFNLRFNPSKNIQVISGYEARKSQTSRWVHIGRAEVRYLF